jgi:hypothetical protein
MQDVAAAVDQDAVAVQRHARQFVTLCGWLCAGSVRYVFKACAWL